jgi:acyl-CoA thioester hydrolase
MPPTDRYVSQTSFYVRYAETDAMRIVHHASYIVYFEEGRSDYMRQRGSNYAQFEQEGLFLAVVEVNARYIKPAVYGQRLTIRTWIQDIGSRGLTWGYEITDQATGQLHVTGQTKHICITADGQVARLPDHWRQAVSSTTPTEQLD